MDAIFAWLRFVVLGPVGDDFPVRVLGVAFWLVFTILCGVLSYLCVRKK